MFLSILSLLFVIGNAVYAILTSPNDPIQMSTPDLAALPNNSKFKSSFCKDGMQLLMQYPSALHSPREFEYFGTPKLSFSQLENAPYRTFFPKSVCFHGEWLIRSESTSIPIYYMSHKEKLKVYYDVIKDIEVIKDELLVNKFPFSVEVKIIHDINFETDDSELLSGIYYYENKGGGIVYDRSWLSK